MADRGSIDRARYTRAKAIGDSDTVYHLPTEAPDVHYSAMALFSMLAYPDETEQSHAQRLRLIDMIQAYHVKRLQQSEGKHQTWAPDELRRIDRHHIARALGKAAGRVNRRLAAGRMAQMACFDLIPPNSGIRVSIPIPPQKPRTRRFSINNIADWIIANHPDDVPENSEHVITHVWTPAKPVIHLAMAYSVKPTDGNLLQAVHTAPDWLPAMLQHAEALVAPLRLRFPKELPHLLRLLPADESHNSVTEK